jgi:ferredoxin-nitrate reductase
MQLLRSGNKADPVLGKLVCSCNNVGSENIVNKIASGCNNLKDLCASTGAGTGCGSCRPEVKRLLEESLKASLSYKIKDDQLFIEGLAVENEEPKTVGFRFGK